MMVAALAIAPVARAQPAELSSIQQVRFTADDTATEALMAALYKERDVSRASTDALCACLLKAQTLAESHGRIDFSVILQTDDLERAGARAHIRMGLPYAVGRINFIGHSGVDELTLRRALTLRERELFDVGKLRRSLDRINAIGLTEPLTLADIVVTRHPGTATADITIPVRMRKRRWWTLSGPVVPGLGSLEASISSRLPAWSRGIFDASTYVVTVNLLALAPSSLGVLKLFSKAPPAMLLFERPLLPGQELLSGFALSPTLSPRATGAHYARTQAGRALRAILEGHSREPLAVPVAGSGREPGEFLLCEPAKSRWRWLRIGAIQAIDIALAAIR
jgi:hypothetical protein